MATDCGDGDYLGAYRRFFEDFVAQVDPDDQLPVKVSTYDLTEAEISGEIIDWTLQYLNQKYCPPSLQSYLVHIVMEEVKVLCSKQPETCGWRYDENTFAPLRLMHAVTSKVNEICSRYLDNSRLALLPPPPSTPIPLVSTCAIKNTRRKMEDRHVVIHDLHAIFSIQDDSAGSYYAVFDGHAGQDAAVYCAAHLHQYLVESIHYPTNPERALRDAFLTTDAHFIEKSNKQNLNSGTTAVCALLLKKKLYIAWVGDSQAVLAKRGQITQLVNPHKPDRDDERERVNDMGGAVMHWGVWRVNGQLAVSRAIGDVQYKPYVTGDPDIRCIPLDGTEDFLIIACDGLWDFVSEAMATTLVYQQLREDPRDLEAVSQRLVYFARSQSSTDNISTIVVFLTNPRQIAARHPSSHPLLADVQLNNMESTNPFLSNANGIQFDANSFGKQQQQQQQQQQATNGTCATDNEENLHYRDNYEATSNGKHANGSGFHDNNADNHGENNEDDDDDDDDEDDDEDDDLGPETDVDAVDEGHVSNVVQPIENLSRELFPEKHDERETVQQTMTTITAAGEGPPASKDLLSSSPCPAEADQNALIPEADNVADSEDSEDEWNYYPNKEKERSLLQSGEAGERKEDKVINSLKSSNEQINDIIGNNELSEAGFNEGDNTKEKEIQQPELIDSDICAKPKSLEELSKAEQEDMDFQLNPNAAEFVPVSPPKILSTRANLNEDFLLSGSPQKQTPEMDDIPVPSQGEFQVEVSLRPHETEHSNGEATKELPPTDFTDYLMDRQKSGNGIASGLDESEISSTKAEFGDESTTSFMTATDLQRTGISLADDSFTGSDRDIDYDISKDPMAMSFTPGDFQAAFEKGGDDLNAIHQLNDSDLMGDEDTPEIIDEHFTAQSPDLHPELTTLVTPDTDHPPPTTAFPDSRGDDIVSANENRSNPISPEPLMKNENLLMSEMVEMIPSSCLFGSHPADKDSKSFDPESGETGYQALNTSSPLGGGATPEKTFGLSPVPAERAFCSVSDAAESRLTQIDIENTVSPIPSAPLNDEASFSPLPGLGTENVGSEAAAAPFEELSASPQTVPPLADATLLESQKDSAIPDLVSFGTFDNQVSPSSPQLASSDDLQVENSADSHQEVYSPILDAELNVSKAIIDHVLDTPPASQDQSLMNEEVNTSPDDQFKLVLDATELHETLTEKEDQEVVPDFSAKFETSSQDQPPEWSIQQKPVFDMARPPFSTGDFSRQDLVVEDNPDDQISSEFATEPVIEESEVPRQQENLIETETDSELQKGTDLLEEANINTENVVSEGELKTLETLVNEKPLINAPVMNLSESMQEFTGLEEQLNPEPMANGIASDTNAKLESQIPAVEATADPVDQAKVLEDADVKQEVTKETEDKEKKESIEKKEDIEKTELKTEESSAATPLAAAAAVAVVAGATAAVAGATAAKHTKTKAAVKPSPRTSTATRTSTNKSTPTSPTKAPTATQRTSGVAPVKKPAAGTASRPKQLETTKTSVTSTTNKLPAAKATTATKSSTLTKTSVSRTSTSAASKPKPTSTTIKANAPSSADKKPTTNGDVKPPSKTAAPKPTLRSSTGTASATTKPPTKTSSTTARSTSGTTTAPPKTRPASAAPAAAKSKLNATGSTSTTTTTRPKSSPAPTGLSVTGATKLRSTPTKSPATDKQIKETTNKQLSSARTGASTLTKTSSRPTSTGTTSSVKRSLLNKNPPPAAAQPQKKPAPITRPGGKLSSLKNAAAKTTITSTTKTEVEVVHNGVTEIHEQKTVITSNTVEEDVPQKDVSPVTSSTDNQLIMTAD